MKIVFLGANTFSALSLKSLLKHSKTRLDLEILTNHFKGESALEKVALENQFKVHRCDSPKSLPSAFNWKNYDLGVVSSFSLFIPPRIIDQIPLINIHPSLLPDFRGPAPIQFTILHGHGKTGVSIIDLHPRTIDAGSILLQKSMYIEGKDAIYYSDLEASLAELGGELTAQVLSDFPAFWQNKQAQDSKALSFSTKVTNADGIVSFEHDHYLQISRKIRALSHQIPIRSIDLIPGRDVIMEDFIFLECDSETIGKFDYNRSLGAVVFRTKDYAYIGVKRFKIDGKSQIYTAGSFYSNYLSKLSV